MMVPGKTIPEWKRARGASRRVRSPLGLGGKGREGLLPRAAAAPLPVRFHPLGEEPPLPGAPRSHSLSVKFQPELPARVFFFSLLFFFFLS